MKTIICIHLAFGFVFHYTSLTAQNKKTTKKIKIHMNKEMEDEIGYTQAIKVGDKIYVSGTVGWGTWDKTLEIAYEELKNTLKACNANFADVVKENIYTMSLDSLKKYSPIRSKYYGNDYPTGSWIEVKRLYNPDILVEIELELIVKD
jgi:2-iminobutanoate/2-iminopropanoate deaminase